MFTEEGPNYEAAEQSPTKNYRQLVTMQLAEGGLQLEVTGEL